MERKYLMKELKVSVFHSIVNCLCLFALLFLESCGSNESETRSIQQSFGNIIYDVDVLPTSDDPWELERTEDLDQKALVDHLFEELYNKKLVAYDFFSGEKLSVDQLRDFEKQEEFSREIVARVQFDEEWGWSNGTLVREVKSFTIAYKIFNHLGEVRGYKPAFLLKVD